MTPCSWLIFRATPQAWRNTESIYNTIVFAVNQGFKDKNWVIVRRVRLNSATSEHRRRLPHNADDYTMVGDERRDQVRSGLIRIASADFFEGTSSDSFRNELAQSLRHVVDACQLKLLAPALRTGSSSPSITRYDTTALGECLSSIDWKGLCVHHDDHVKDVSKLSTAASTSWPLPLSLLLEP
jgi:hypothetical protein